MTITEESWKKYIDDLRKVNNTAADIMVRFMEKNQLDWRSTEARRMLLDYSFEVSKKYGMAASELACEMYDEMALLSGVAIPSAEPAAVATYGEVAKSVNGVLKYSISPEMIAGAVVRWVKMAGVDTTMKNAVRDGAEWAWIPNGDTCAFCIALASRGWQTASKKALKNGHAEHIHANCDCTYSVRFNEDTNVQGYDPDKYLEMYDDANADTKGKVTYYRDTDGDIKRHRQSESDAKINAMRREQYAQNKDEINAQKRAAYAERREREAVSKEQNT